MAVGEGEFSGRTVDDAIAEAEASYGVSRDDLIVEVVTAGSRGVFGIGAEQARVRARPRTATSAVAEPPSTPAPEEPSSPVQEVRQESAAGPGTAVGTAPEPEVEQEEQRPALDGAELAEEASTVLRQLLDNMGFQAEVSVRSAENPVMLAVTGENLGVLIGRRGDNLSALQFMVNLILSKHRRQWPRIVIDIENYRARREESLRSLADRMAYRVRRSGRPFTLEAMPASDRRIIHLSLRDREDIETYSIGEGLARRVVIAPKRVAGRATNPGYR